MKHPHPYRTVTVAIIGMACALAGLALTAFWPVAAASYPAFVGCIGFCVGAVAGKATMQHKAEAQARAEAVPA